MECFPTNESHQNVIFSMTIYTNLSTIGGGSLYLNQITRFKDLVIILCRLGYTY